MAPAASLPSEAGHPGINLLQHYATGEYYSSYDAFFEYVVNEKFSQLQLSKSEEKDPKALSPTAVLWHERNAPRIELEEYRTDLDFHVELCVMFLVPITPMRSLGRLVNTLYEYLECRFMKNEKVMVHDGHNWVPARIIDVRHELAVPAGTVADGTRYLPQYFRYDVLVMEDIPKRPDSLLSNLRCTHIRRPVGAYSRTLLRACILQHCKCREPTKTDAFWSLKRKTLEFYDLNDLSWWDMFTGPEPRFNVPSKPSKHFPRQDKLDKDAWNKIKAKKDKKGGHSSLDSAKKSGEPSSSGGKRRREDDERNIHDYSSYSKKPKFETYDRHNGFGKMGSSFDRAKTQEDKKLKQQEYKKRWREKMKKDKQKISSAWANIFSVKEDLECPGLKPIAVMPQRLETALPDEYIGDGLFILEFLRTFGSEFDKDPRLIDSEAWDLDKLHQSISSSTIDGDLTVVLTFCAKAMMACAPYYPENAPDTQMPVYTNGWQNSGVQILRYTRDRLGMSFFNLPLQGSTISEIIRLCLLVACVPIAGIPANETKADSLVLRYLKSPVGAETYRTLVTKSIFGLSFGQRMELVMLMIQSVMESGVVRQKVEGAAAVIEESERSLKGFKSLADEMSRIAHAKIAAAAKERPADKSSEKGDRFRQILEHYKGKRSGRMDREKSTKDLVEDLKALDEGRKKRRLVDLDFTALAEALADLKAKFDVRMKEEREQIANVFSQNGQNFRMDSVGLDRHFFRYWTVTCVPGLLIECATDRMDEACCPGCFCEEVLRIHRQYSKSCSWWVLKTEFGMTNFSKSLMVTGEREVVLKRALEAKVPLTLERLAGAAESKPVVVPEEARAVPQIVPEEGWDAQLRTKLTTELLDLNAELVTHHFGGISDAPARQNWENHLLGLSVTKSDGDQADENVPSPEICPPAVESRRTSTEKAEAPSMLNGEKRKESPAEPEMKAEKKPASRSTSLINSPEAPEEDSDSDDDDDRKGSEKRETDEKNTTLNEGTAMPDLTGQLGSVKHLVSGLLQLVESIKQRHIGAPLKTVDEDFVQDATPLERWKTALRTCTTLPQISLHLAVLQQCLLWQKSTINSSCRACRKRGDSTNLVACDRCDRIFHLDCVKPPLTEVPEDEWACPVCVPFYTAPRSNRRGRNQNVNYNEESLAAKAEQSPLPGPTKEITSEIETKNIISGRTARAMQRSKGDWEELPGEDDHGLRRSGRTRRIDYKNMVDPGSKKESGEEKSPEKDKEKSPEEPEEIEMALEGDDMARRSSSEDSEFDPDTKPHWGKKHKAKR